MSPIVPPCPPAPPRAQNRTGIHGRVGDSQMDRDACSEGWATAAHGENSGPVDVGFDLAVLQGDIVIPFPRVSFFLVQRYQDEICEE